MKINIIIVIGSVVLFASRGYPCGFAGGYASSPKIIDGKHIKIETWTGHLSVYKSFSDNGDAVEKTRVKEKIVLVQPHDAFTIAVRDEIADEELISFEHDVLRNEIEKENPNLRESELESLLDKAYKERKLPYKKTADWALKDFEIIVDGRKLDFSHTGWEYKNEEIFGWDGAFIATIPQSAHTIEIIYSYCRLTDQTVESTFYFSSAKLRGWGGPPQRSVLIWDGIGDLPATHIIVDVGYTKNTSLWKFSSGTVFSEMINSWPPSIKIAFRDGSLCTRDKKRFCISRFREGTYCGLGWPCVGVLADADSNYNIDKWERVARTGRYDRRSLELGKNWILALHGAEFKEKWLRDYFQAQPWYEPDPKFSLEMLSEKEKDALRRIEKMLERTMVEEKKGQKKGCNH